MCVCVYIRRALCPGRVRPQLSTNKQTSFVIWKSRFGTCTCLWGWLRAVTNRGQGRKIRRALCPGRVRSGHDPVSHVPGSSWIVCSIQR